MLISFVLSSCRKKEALNGNLTIVLNSNIDISIYYELYPEGTCKPDILISLLRSG